MRPDLPGRIFQIKDQISFLELALEIFNYQYDNNPVYHEFIDMLGVRTDSVLSLTKIPFIPVRFFKSRKIMSGNLPARLVFESSGTTGRSTGRHFIADPGLYEESLLKTFRLFYGEPSDYIIAALVPSAAERKNSSLAFMVDKLVSASANTLSGFYLENINKLISNLKAGRSENQKIILIGLSYALMNIADEYSMDLSGAIVMETGGMKGRVKEITREELHLILEKKFNISSVHSEYGMTELLSQAYSAGEGIFHSPPWMKVLIRDPQDPFALATESDITGAFNIIDLANLYSCSFIATDDFGRLHNDGGFEVLGRLDNTDIRGCSLMLE